jgi:hypothetical protein
MDPIISTNKEDENEPQLNTNTLQQKHQYKKLQMLTQRCILARCLIKIEGHYSCERNPVLPSVSALQR